MPKGNPEGYSKSPRKRAAAAKKKITGNFEKNFPAGGKKPLRVPRRATKGGGGGVPYYPASRVRRTGRKK